AAGDRRVHAVRPHRREHLQVAAGLRRRVRARRPERVVLLARDAFGHVAVDLVRRYLDEADARLPSEAEQLVRADDVGLDELGRAQDRAVDVRLRGEVDDGAGPGRGGSDGSEVADVALDELAVATVEVRPVARVRQLVEDDDLVAGGHEALREVRADEPGTAGDEHAHGPKATGRSRRLSGLGFAGAPGIVLRLSVDEHLSSTFDI